MACPMSHLNIARLPENLTQMLRHSVNCSLSQCHYFGCKLTFKGSIGRPRHSFGPDVWIRPRRGHRADGEFNIYSPNAKREVRKWNFVFFSSCLLGAVKWIVWHLASSDQTELFAMQMMLWFSLCTWTLLHRYNEIYFAAANKSKHELIKFPVISPCSPLLFLHYFYNFINSFMYCMVCFHSFDFYICATSKSSALWRPQHN